MKREDFFKRYPHMFELPPQPQCIHCWQVSSWRIVETGRTQAKVLCENHTEFCPLSERNGQDYVVVRVIFKDGKIREVI